MKILFNKKIFFLFSCIALLLPNLVFASTVYLDSNHSDFFVGDTIMFNVLINSEDKDINTIGGDILLDYPTGSVSLVDINTSDSKLSIWPNKPLPSMDNKSISFVGGSPGGFDNNGAIVFNIVLKFQKAGQITLSPSNIEVYLNDGKGTKDKVKVKNLIVDVLPKNSDTQPVDDWGSIISKDKKPPEPFEIYLAQENSVFEGKKFLSFNTTDKQSDVAYYEVIEGDLPPVRSTDTYVLLEQSKPVKVVVVAYDSAGNARKSVYSPASQNVSYPAIIIFVIILTFVFVIHKKRIKNDYIQ